MHAIAGSLGVTNHRVHELLTAYGIPVRPPRGRGRAVSVPSMIDVEVLRREYVVDGRSAAAIAIRLGVTKSRVEALLKSHDIKPHRERGRHRRAEALHVAGFQSMVSHSHAYWCGFLLASRPYRDPRNPDRLQLEVASEEAAHLENLRDCLGRNAPGLRSVERAAGVRVTVLTIDSASLSAALAPWNVGVDQRDWRAIRLPRVPAARLPSYLRGYVDARFLPDLSSPNKGCFLSAMGSLDLGADLLRSFQKIGVPPIGVKRLRSAVIVGLCPSGRGLGNLVAMMYERADVFLRRQRTALQAMALARNRGE